MFLKYENLYAICFGIHLIFIRKDNVRSMRNILHTPKTPNSKLISNFYIHLLTTETPFPNKTDFSNYLNEKFKLFQTYYEISVPTLAESGNEIYK